MQIINSQRLPRSAYIHIPFCHRRCFYCDFAIVPLGDRADAVRGPGSNSINSYLNLLHREIELTPLGPPLSTVYIGGGTPSLLTPFQVRQLLIHLDRRYGLSAGAEITLEMDPASFDQTDLEAFLDVGINRVSLGGQSFEDSVLEKLGRRHKRNDLLNACKWLRASFKEGRLQSWSLDLIQNLPGQLPFSWKSELIQAIESESPHLSIYDLTLEPGTVFAWRHKRGELNLPEEDLSAEMMDMTSGVLIQAGFARYEISNYAFPGHACRHNRVYWKGSGWWGFGMGATSSPWGQRFARPKTRDKYSNWIEEQEVNGPNPSFFSDIARPGGLDEMFLVGLRCREGLDLFSIARSWGWDQAKCGKYLPLLEVQLQRSFAEGLLCKKGKTIQLTNPKGMAFSNQVFVEFVLWWESLPPDVVDQPRFAMHQ